jgi:hypothetical protein
VTSRAAAKSHRRLARLRFALGASAYLSLRAAALVKIKTTVCAVNRNGTRSDAIVIFPSSRARTLAAVAAAAFKTMLVVFMHYLLFLRRVF